MGSAQGRLAPSGARLERRKATITVSSRPALYEPEVAQRFRQLVAAAAEVSSGRVVLDLTSLLPPVAVTAELVLAALAELQGRALGLCVRVHPAVAMGLSRLGLDALMAVEISDRPYGPEAAQCHRWQRLERVLHHLHDYRHESLCVEKLAQMVSVSPRTIQRDLRDLLGRTLSDYLMELRLELAKELLLNTDRSPGDIASDMGMGLARFYTRFKEQTGLTPQAYRERAG